MSKPSRILFYFISIFFLSFNLATAQQLKDSNVKAEQLKKSGVKVEQLKESSAKEEAPVESADSLIIMKHVPQKLGFYDSDYSLLKEADCRACHGNSLADRHHETQRALSRDCQDCHEVKTKDGKQASGDFITKSALRTGKEGQFGVTIQRDCLQCHKTSWHHKTDYAKTGKCTTCHSDQIVTDVKGEVPIRNPISKITPTPTACSNCHGATEEAPPGLSKYIKAPEDNHHDTGIETCTLCHQNEDDDVEIKGCEGCHGKDVLHNIQPHVKNNDRCFGCHGSNLKQFAKLPQKPPVVTSVDRKSYLVDEAITIKGSGFGDYLSKFLSKVTVATEEGEKSLPIVNWSNDSINTRMAYEFFEDPGVYKLQVVTQKGKSAVIDVNIFARPVIAEIVPAIVKAGGTISIQGSNFGKLGTDNQVTLTVSQQEYPATINSWSDDEIEATVPSNISSGEVSISVKTERSYAVSDKPVTIAGDLKIELRSVRPKTASPGDVVRLIGFNFGTVSNNGSILLGVDKLEIVKWNSSMIMVRVPMQAKEGTQLIRIQVGEAFSNTKKLTVQ